MEIVQASAFKAKCLALLDQVAETHEEILVTKDGSPVAILVPILEHSTTDRSVTFLSDDDSDYFSTDEVWDAESYDPAVHSLW